MIRQARDMVASGELGTIRIVQAEYPQDWLTSPMENEGLKQAEWRTDPIRSGAGGSIGDIGTHAHNLACFVSGLQVESLAADLHAFGAGRTLDDNAHIMLRFTSGARGMLWSSQVAPGNENALKLRIYGDMGGLEWCQEDPNYLWFTHHGESKRLLTRNGSGASAASQTVSRIPGGHPEGYLEGFATIYNEAANAIRAVQVGADRASVMGVLPGITAGMDGMKFINACVTSSSNDATWTNL
jgi:predicted dehydrogenase